VSCLGRGNASTQIIVKSVRIKRSNPDRIPVLRLVSILLFNLDVLNAAESTELSIWNLAGPGIGFGDEAASDVRGVCIIQWEA
jgi:hypothetical protein